MPQRCPKLFREYKHVLYYIQFEAPASCQTIARTHPDVLCLAVSSLRRSGEYSTGPGKRACHGSKITISHRAKKEDKASAHGREESDGCSSSRILVQGQKEQRSNKKLMLLGLKESGIQDSCTWLVTTGIIVFQDVPGCTSSARNTMSISTTAKEV